MARTTIADLRAIIEAQAAQTAALIAALEAQTARKSAPRAPRPESPSQTMFRTRTAGTCVVCGRADFRTVKGAIGHLTTPAGDACVRTPERDAGFGVEPAAAK